MEKQVNHFSNRDALIIKIATIFAFACIIAGFVLNEWVLVRLLSSDGALEVGTKYLIRAFDFFAICLGIWLLRNRHNMQLHLNLITFLVTLSVMMLLVEVGLRTEKIVRAHKQANELQAHPGPFQENPSGAGSYRIRPNLSMVLGGGETVQTNSFGMRWREVSPDNPQKKQRIAFVGDSFTFGMAASSVEKTFVGVFDSLIDQSRYEVLNFGVPGYGFPDMELVLHEKVLQFKPRYVILMSYNGNDFSDTFFGLNRFKIKNGYLGQGLIQECVDKLPKQYRTPPPQQSFLERIELHNRIAGLMAKVHERFFWNAPPRIDFWIDDNFMGSNVFWSRTDYPPVAVESKDLSLKTLERIKAFCDKNQIELIIMTIPFKEQIYAMSEKGEGYDIQYPQKYIADFADGREIPFFDLLPLLRAEPLVKSKNIFSPESHFSDEGYELVGKIIFDLFQSEVLRKHADN